MDLTTLDGLRYSTTTHGEQSAMTVLTSMQPMLFVECSILQRELSAMDQVAHMVEEKVISHLVMNNR